MSSDKKWSSNDRNQLLTENFRKFMEEGDFSPNVREEETPQERGEKMVSPAPATAQRMVANIAAKVQGQKPEIVVADKFGGADMYPIRLDNKTAGVLAKVMEKFPQDMGSLTFDVDGNRAIFTVTTLIGDPGTYMEVGYIDPKGEYVPWNEPRPYEDPHGRQ